MKRCYSARGPSNCASMWGYLLFISLFITTFCGLGKTKCISLVY